MYIRVDLSDYEDEVFKYAEENGYIEENEAFDRSKLEELVEEIEKELCVYTTKSMTLEDALRRLKELI